MTELNAQEAKTIVLLAFRNGPIESVHGELRCPHCPQGQQDNRIDQQQMKLIMKTAVDRVYTLMKTRDESPEAYKELLAKTAPGTARWDDPRFSLQWLAAVAGLILDDDQIPEEYRVERPPSNGPNGI